LVPYQNLAARALADWQKVARLAGRKECKRKPSTARFKFWRKNTKRIRFALYETTCLVGPKYRCDVGRADAGWDMGSRLPHDQTQNLLGITTASPHPAASDTPGAATANAPAKHSSAACLRAVGRGETPAPRQGQKTGKQRKVSDPQEKRKGAIFLPDLDKNWLAPLRFILDPLLATVLPARRRIRGDCAGGAVREKDTNNILLQSLIRQPQPPPPPKWRRQCPKRSARVPQVINQMNGQHSVFSCFFLTRRPGGRFHQFSRKRF